MNFRKAVSCAIDRKTIAKDVFYGLLDPTRRRRAPTVTSYFNADADRANGFDLARAKAFLAKSKYAEKPEFELLVPAIPYLFDAKDAAVVMQSQLAAAGITVKLTLMEQPQILTRDIGGTQVASLLPLMAPSDPTFLIQLCYTADQLMSKSSGYTNPALDAAIEESYRYTDAARLDPVLKKIQAILAEDCPNIWLGFVVVANAWRDRVQGFQAQYRPDHLGARRERELNVALGVPQSAARLRSACWSWSASCCSRWCMPSRSHRRGSSWAWTRPRRTSPTSTMTTGWIGRSSRNI